MKKNKKKLTKAQISENAKKRIALQKKEEFESMRSRLAKAEEKLEAVNVFKEALKEFLGMDELESQIDTLENQVNNLDDGENADDDHIRELAREEAEDLLSGASISA